MIQNNNPLNQININYNTKISKMLFNNNIMWIITKNNNNFKLNFKVNKAAYNIFIKVVFLRSNALHIESNFIFSSELFRFNLNARF